MKKYLIALAVGLLPSLTTMAQNAENLGKEQTAEKWIKNIDASITTGTTGIGFDVAVPVNDMVTLRTGYSWMPRTHVTMNFGVQVGDEKLSQEEETAKFNNLANMLEEYSGTRVDSDIDMVGTPTMNNFKLLVDVHPFLDRNWHITAGFYWGPSKIAKAENAIYDGTSLVAVSMYNNLYERVKSSYENFIPYMNIGDQYLYAGKELYDKFMSYGRMGVRLGNRTDGSIFRLEPDANNNVSATIRVNSFKPYLGFGYGGRLFRDNDIYHISFDAGILFWGGTPRITTNDIHKVTFSPNEDYTEAIKNETIEPGVNLAKDVYNIPGKVGDYVKFFKGFKVYPVLELRLSRRISF